jgi:3',5'-cyclic AMP phosphodiesterase CpdA
VLLNKRIFGWMKWRFERRRIHRPEVLAALLADLQRLRPDHVVITGDLTNIGLEAVFAEAGVWLRRLGDRQFVSLVPGNHDAYVPEPWRAAWRHWKEYLESDGSKEALLPPAASFWELTDEYFPSVRIRGPIALVGVCTAQPVGVTRASGAVGARQLARLERILRELAATDLCRVVLLHHPPLPDDVAWRALTDSAAVREVLRRAGADLVLHGHAHLTMRAHLPGPDTPIPVVGVRSASDIGSAPDRVAQYHVYRIERAPGGPSLSASPFRMTMEIREYEAASGRFHYVSKEEL